MSSAPTIKGGSDEFIIPYHHPVNPQDPMEFTVDMDAGNGNGYEKGNTNRNGHSAKSKPTLGKTMPLLRVDQLRDLLRSRLASDNSSTLRVHIDADDIENFSDAEIAQMYYLLNSREGSPENIQVIHSDTENGKDDLEDRFAGVRLRDYEESPKTAVSMIEKRLARGERTTINNQSWEVFADNVKKASGKNRKVLEDQLLRLRDLFLKYPSTVLRFREAVDKADFDTLCVKILNERSTEPKTLVDQEIVIPEQAGKLTRLSAFDIAKHLTEGKQTIISHELWNAFKESDLDYKTRMKELLELDELFASNDEAMLRFERQSDYLDFDGLCIEAAEYFGDLNGSNGYASSVSESGLKEQRTSSVAGIVYALNRTDEDDASKTEMSAKEKLLTDEELENSTVVINGNPDVAGQYDTDTIAADDARADAETSNDSLAQFQTSEFVAREIPQTFAQADTANTPLDERLNSVSDQHVAQRLKTLIETVQAAAITEQRVTMQGGQQVRSQTIDTDTLTAATEEDRSGASHSVHVMRSQGESDQQEIVTLSEGNVTRMHITSDSAVPEVPKDTIGFNSYIEMIDTPAVIDQKITAHPGFAQADATVVDTESLPEELPAGDVAFSEGVVEISDEPFSLRSEPERMPKLSQGKFAFMDADYVQAEVNNDRSTGTHEQSPPSAPFVDDEQVGTGEVPAVRGTEAHNSPQPVTDDTVVLLPDTFSVQDFSLADPVSPHRANVEHNRILTRSLEIEEERKPGFWNWTKQTFGGMFGRRK